MKPNTILSSGGVASPSEGRKEAKVSSWDEAVRKVAEEERTREFYRQVAASRERPPSRAEREAAREAELAATRQRENEIKALNEVVRQFLAAMKAAKNPGLSRYQLGFNETWDFRGKRAWEWWPVVVLPNGEWGYKEYDDGGYDGNPSTNVTRFNVHSTVMIPSSSFIPDIGTVRESLVRILLKNRVRIPRG
jgi:hypothetical protein